MAKTNGSKNDENTIKTTSYTSELHTGVTAAIQQSARSIAAMERKISKLNDLASQGEGRQRGFLTHKQTNMYRDMMSEIEQMYQKHYERLQQMEERYNQTREQAREEVARREERLKQSEGKNRWGHESIPKVQEFYRTKLVEAENRQREIESGPVGAELNTLRQQVASLQSVRQTAQDPSQRLSDMHVWNRNTSDLIGGARQFAGKLGLATSAMGVGAYAISGMNELRNQEYSGALLGQKLGNYEGNDAGLRNEAVRLGLQNQYGGAQTLQTQGALIRGGTSGNYAALGRDTVAVQSFGRAHGVDTGEVAQASTTLRKMGIVNEGEAHRIAGIFAKEINRQGMKGREEELLRSTTSLLQSVGNKLTSMNETQAVSVMALQGALGDADPSLKGDRGASVLGNMDSAIKGGSNNLDVLMGKGSDPRYTGIEGYYRLKKQQEQGLANPQNMKDVLEGVKRFGGTIDSTYSRGLIAENLGLSLNQEEVMYKSGIYNQVMEGNFDISEDKISELVNGGLQGDQADLLRQWSKSNAQEVQGNKAKNSWRTTAIGKMLERPVTAVNSFFGGLPDPVQTGLTVGGGMGLNTLIQSRMNRSLIEQIARQVTPTAGGASAGGILNGMRTAGSNIVQAPGRLPGAFSGAYSKVNALDDLVLSGLGKIPGVSSGAGAIGSALGKVPGLATVGKGLGRVASKVPIVGIGIGTALDQMSNPQHSLGRSIFKGVGGALGGMAGLAGAAALGVGTGGAGLLATGGLVMGGGIGGEKIADSIYSKLFGDDDKTVNMSSQDPLYSDPNSVSDTADIKSINAQSLNIQDKGLDRYLDSNKQSNKTTFQESTPSPPVHSSFNDSNATSNNKSRNIKITIDGKIDGMTEDNQHKVQTSIVDYFSKLSGAGVDISFDQRFN